MSVLEEKNPLEDALEEEELKHWLNCENADFYMRTAAYILDFILAYLAVTGIDHICNAINSHLSHVVNFNSSYLSNLISIFLKTCFALFYYGATTALSGGTAGKLLIGLRVIDETDGKSLSFPRAVLRELFAYFSLPLSPYLFFSKDKTALHDKLTRTRIKRVRGRT